MGLGVSLENKGAATCAPESKDSGWLTDFPKARELARQTGQPLFVVFR
jgi:hypothetical protein